MQELEEAKLNNGFDYKEWIASRGNQGANESGDSSLDSSSVLTLINKQLASMKEEEIMGDGAAGPYDEESSVSTSTASGRLL